MHPLEQWRQAQGIDRRAFARKLKKHENSVYLWETYKVVPGRNVMARSGAWGLLPASGGKSPEARMKRAIHSAGIVLAVWLLGAVVIVVAVPHHIGDGLVFWTGGLALLAFVLWTERG